MEHRFYLLKEKEIYFRPSKNLRLGNISCALSPTEPENEVNRTKCEAFAKLLHRKLLRPNWVLNMNFKFNHFRDIEGGVDGVATDAVLKGIFLNNLTDTLSFSDGWSAPPILKLEGVFFKDLTKIRPCCHNSFMTGFEASQDSDGCPIFMTTSCKVDHRCVVEGIPESSPCIQEILSYGEGPTSYDIGNGHWKMCLTLILRLREAPKGTSDSYDEDNDFSDGSCSEEGFKIALNMSNINISGKNSDKLSEENMDVHDGREGSTSNGEESEGHGPQPIRTLRARLQPDVVKVSSSKIKNKVDVSISQKKDNKRKLRDDEGPDVKRMTMGDA